jgi:polysaccharide export outer membrane protein
MKVGSGFLFVLLGGCAVSWGQEAPSPDALQIRNKPAPPAPTPAQVDAVSSQPVDTSTYVLGPDDQVKIWALGMEEIGNNPIRINPSGDIDLPLIGKVHAGGLTADQLKAKLEERFAKEVRHPQVTVEIQDFGSQPVSVMGAVTHTGIVQLRGHKTLTEVLAMEDGLRPDSGPRITITRQIQYGPVPLPGATTDPTGRFSVGEVNVKELLAGTKPAENILICPHDTITVPLAEVVYVTGEVHRPGEVTLKDRETIPVLQALASAEGYGPNPAPQNAFIVRIDRKTNKEQRIPVDLRKIQQGGGEDVMMRPNDILLVPISGPKKLAARVAEAAIQAAVGAAVFRP